MADSESEIKEAVRGARYYVLRDVREPIWTQHGSPIQAEIYKYIARIVSSSTPLPAVPPESRRENESSGDVRLDY